MASVVIAEMDARTLTAMTVSQAARFLVECARGIEEAVGVVLKEPAVTEKLYRRAVKRTHPDVGGDTVRFAKLVEAKRVLDQHHQRKGR